MKRLQEPAATTLPVTRRLAEFASGLRFADLPADAILVAKQSLLDWFGVTLAAVTEPMLRILVDQALEDGGLPQATLVGFGHRTSVANAALVNGAAGHALDYDDVMRALRGHPSAPVAPVVLALAERDGLPGREVLTAFVAGVEVESRVGQLMGDGHYEKGWHSTGTNGTFGAAAAAARLLGLNADATARALGIAGTQAAGLKAQFGTMCKPLHAGKAAANGLLAARLAARGFTSVADILEGDQGYAETQTPAADPVAALAGLGTEFQMPNALFKYHAACYGTHAPIEAAARLRRHPAFAVERLRRAEVRVGMRCLRQCTIPEPTTGLEGKFSLRYTTALALLGESTAALASFSDAAVGRPHVNRVRDTVTVEGVPAFDRNEAEVIVHMADGTVLRERADVGKPNPDRRQQGEMLARKFTDLATPVVGAAQAAAIAQAVAEFERLGTLADLMAATAPGG